MEIADVQPVYGLGAPADAHTGSPPKGEAILAETAGGESYVRTTADRTHELVSRIKRCATKY